MANPQLRTNNTKLGTSIVDYPLEPKGQVYIHMGTGEIVLIPPEHETAFRGEFGGLNDAVANYHSANQAICALSKYREDNRHISAEAKKAETALGYAHQWRDEACKTYHALFDGLKLEAKDDKKKTEGGGEEGENGSLLAGQGKLIELATLSKEKKEKEGEKKGEEKKGEGYTKTLLKAGGYKQMNDLGKLSGGDMEKVVYVRQSVAKKWPDMQVLDNKGWKRVFTKENGKTKLDKHELKKYVAEKVKGKVGEAGMEWLKERLGIKNLDYERSGTVDIGDLWIFKLCDKWNEELKAEAGWKLTRDGRPLLDIDLTASAQLMRYTYGVSLNPQVDLEKGEISVRAEGHAELDVARAGAQLKLSFPGESGWIWTFKDKKGEVKNIVTILVEVTLGVLGVVGASVAVELSVSTSQKTVSDPLGVKGTPGPAKPAERSQNSVGLRKEANVRPVGLDAGVAAFAGAKAEGSIKGSLKWRNPESDDKSFEEIASITAEGSVMAGLAGSANFAVEYLDGMFHLTAHASLCFGLGAEGEVTFNVDTGQVEKFCKHVFYSFLSAEFSEEFEELEIIKKKTFDTLNAIWGLVAVNPGKTVGDYYGQDGNVLTDEWQYQLDHLDCNQLATLVTSAQGVLRYSFPMLKGNLLHSICNLSNGLLSPADLETVKRAVLAVLKMMIIVPDLENSLRHMMPGGVKGSVEDALTRLRNLFRKGISLNEGGLEDMANADDDGGTAEGMPPDEIALSGDFDGWYESYRNLLAPRMPLGYAVSYLGADGADVYTIVTTTNDHRLFTSEGWNPFYPAKGVA